MNGKNRSFFVKLEKNFFNDKKSLDIFLFKHYNKIMYYYAYTGVISPERGKILKKSLQKPSKNEDFGQKFSSI